MWDHGAMSHGCEGVEGMGAMRWTWEGCMGGGGGGESGEAERAGMHWGRRERQDWGHELEPGSGRGHGHEPWVPGGRGHGGHAMDMGRVHGEGGG